MKNPDAVKENTEVSGTEQNAASLPADGTASKPTSATATVTEHQTTNETATAPTEPETQEMKRIQKQIPDGCREKVLLPA